jgi:osmotically-inducible protein OsmY
MSESMSVRVTDRILLPLILAGVAGPGLGGCTAMLIGDGQGGAQGERPAASASRSDAEISATVRSRLLSDTSVEAGGIDVATAGGRVTLSGTVTTFGERDKAARLAASVPGVVSVENRLAVGAGQ